MKLSILIPTTPDRGEYLFKLGKQFGLQLGRFVGSDVIFKVSDQTIWVETYRQGNFDDVEVIYYEDNRNQTIGYKRNTLLDVAAGEYIAFVDSDDRIGDNYFKHAFKGINMGVDACGLTGIITEDGKNPKKFVHSFRYDHWYEENNIYYRNNNHLNVIKKSIATQIKFPETSKGEDHDYSKRLYESGLVTTEYWDENEVIYFYDFINNK